MGPKGNRDKQTNKQTDKHRVSFIKKEIIVVLCQDLSQFVSFIVELFSK